MCGAKEVRPVQIRCPCYKSHLKSTSVRTGSRVLTVHEQTKDYVYRKAAEIVSIFLCDLFNKMFLTKERREKAMQKIQTLSTAS